MKLQSFEEFVNESAVRFSSNPTHPKVALQGLQLLSQIRLWHWQVTIGDLHKALGDFYDSISGLNDTLVEAMMGKYGRFTVSGTTQSPSPILVDYDVNNFDSAIAEYEDFYTSGCRDLFANDPEICNILDEIVAEIQKIKYLSTMS